MFSVSSSIKDIKTFLCKRYKSCIKTSPLSQGNKRNYKYFLKIKETTIEKIDHKKSPSILMDFSLNLKVYVCIR